MVATLFSFFLTFLLLAPSLGIAGDEGAAQKSVKVTIKPLKSLVIHPRDDATATVVSLNATQISPEVTGKISNIAVKVGDVVKQGQIIVRLDSWLYSGQLQQAQGVLKELEVGLELAKKERDRAVRLRKKGQSTQAVLDSKIAQVDSYSAKLIGQRSRVAESRTRLNKATITAPFSGLITKRSGHKGSWVGPGTPIVTLVDLQAVELVAEVASLRVEQFKKAGDMVFIHMEEKYPVSIRAILAIENSATQTREVRLRFVDNKPPPGATGRLTWVDPRAHLPPWVLVRRNNSLGLFLSEKSVAKFLPIPSAYEGLAALLPAMDGPQDVIIDGRESLKHGDSLSIIPRQD
ncbi:MAG: efflux RND transporter periplasmic adaptor subunit [Magnetococcales bacterium]|nr:efflux RND transporter periplasmic adaptor subunit [Magnetococcales bacterium]